MVAGAQASLGAFDGLLVAPLCVGLDMKAAQSLNLVAKSGKVQHVKGSNTCLTAMIYSYEVGLPAAAPLIKHCQAIAILPAHLACKHEGRDRLVSACLNTALTSSMTGLLVLY